MIAQMDHLSSQRILDNLADLVGYSRQKEREEPMAEQPEEFTGLVSFIVHDEGETELALFHTLSREAAIAWYATLTDLFTSRVDVCYLMGISGMKLVSSREDEPLEEGYVLRPDDPNFEQKLDHLTERVMRSLFSAN